jgi:hypothetical protein
VHFRILDDLKKLHVFMSVSSQPLRPAAGQWALYRRATIMMDEALRYLIHFFTDKEHLFKTIMMAEACQIDAISDRFVSQKGWYWGRYSKSERHDYLNRRRFVEKELFDGYTQAYGRLKEKVPVYFYLYPKITTRKAITLAQQRTKHDEVEPGILMVKMQDIEDITNITFTLNDSCSAYWKKTIDARIKCKGPQPDMLVLQDHNKVFPFSMIEEMYRRYSKQDMYYEVQIWDYELLERIPYTILREEKV